MRINKPGLITEGFYMLGSNIFPLYLIDGKNPVVFDAGVAMLGKAYVEDIRTVLGERQPAYLLLTHTHFDHCGAVAYLKKAFPFMQVLASKKAQELVKKTHVLKHIRNLNQMAVLPVLEGNCDFDSTIEFQPFEIDRLLYDGEYLKIDTDLYVLAIETTGHTPDSFSFYLPDKKILIASDAAGIAGSNGIFSVDFLSSFDQFYSSLKKLSELDIDIICLGHRWVFTGEDVSKHIKDTFTYCIQFRDLVEKYLVEKNGDIKQVVEAIKQFEYDSLDGPKQPEQAYLLNLEARVTAVKNYLSLKDRKTDETTI